MVVDDIRRLPWIWSKLIWWQRSVNSILEAASYDPEKQIPAKSYDWLDDPKKVFDGLEERRKALAEKH